MDNPIFDDYMGYDFVVYDGEGEEPNTVLVLLLIFVSFEKQNPQRFQRRL